MLAPFTVDSDRLKTLSTAGVARKIRPTSANV